MYQPIGNPMFIIERGFTRFSRLPLAGIKNMATSLLKPLLDELAFHAAYLRYYLKDIFLSQ